MSADNVCVGHTWTRSLARFMNMACSNTCPKRGDICLACSLFIPQEQDTGLGYRLTMCRDLVAEQPSRRQVPFENTVAYIASEVAGVKLSTTPKYSSSDSKRSSGYWNQDEGWDSCHEVNAKDGEGIEEVFRVIARKLVEQKHKRDTQVSRLSQPPAAGNESGSDYFTGAHATGSFRLGHGDRDKRRSWLGLPSVGIESAMTPRFITTDVEEARRKGRCC